MLWYTTIHRLEQLWTRDISCYVSRSVLGTSWHIDNQCREGNWRRSRERRRNLLIKKINSKKFLFYRYTMYKLILQIFCALFLLCFNSFLYVSISFIFCSVHSFVLFQVNILLISSLIIFVWYTVCLFSVFRFI